MPRVSMRSGDVPLQLKPAFYRTLPGLHDRATAELEPEQPQNCAAPKSSGYRTLVDRTSVRLSRGR
jgi:hypothetical protein